NHRRRVCSRTVSEGPERAEALLGCADHRMREGRARVNVGRRGSLTVIGGTEMAEALFRIARWVLANTQRAMRKRASAISVPPITVSEPRRPTFTRARPSLIR